MGRTEYMNRISYQLSVLAARVKTNSQNGRTDINVDSEMTICGLINLVMGWELENLNDRKANFPGIDLADWRNRIAVQVTATATGRKVNHSLDKFLENGFDSSFDRLITVIITTDKLPSAAARKHEDFSFNPATDIWNINTLTGLVKNVNDAKELEEIANYLEKEIGSPAPNPNPCGKNHSAGKIMWFAALLALVVAVGVIWGVSRVPQDPQTTLVGIEDLWMWDTVASTLRKETLDKTTVPLSVYKSGLNSCDNLGSARNHSIAYPFTLWCANTATNPIAAFNAVRAEWFTSQDMSAVFFWLPLRDDSEMLDPYAWQEYLDGIPDVQTKSWEWSETGVEAFLCDVLAVAGKCEDNLDFDDQFLSALRCSEEPVIHFSAEEKGQCYYTYFIYYGDYTSYLISMYFHEDKENPMQISDVEFQMLNMSYYSADPDFSGAQDTIRNGCKGQVASLIMSIEHLLTGSSVFDSEIQRLDRDSEEIVIPLDYSVGDYQVSIIQKSYEGAMAGIDDVGDHVERCQLITYRICK